MSCERIASLALGWFARIVQRRKIRSYPKFERTENPVWENSAEQ